MRSLGIALLILMSGLTGLCSLTFAIGGFFTSPQDPMREPDVFPFTLPGFAIALICFLILRRMRRAKG